MKKKDFFDHSKLRALMAEKNISAIEVAQKMGKNRGTVSLWKTGKSNPTLMDTAKLGAVLGVDYRIFYKGDTK